MKTTLWMSTILLAGLLVSSGSPVFPQTNAGPGDDARNIMVKFRNDLAMTLHGSGAPVDRAGKGLRSPSTLSRMDAIAAAGGSWIRMSGAPEGETERLRETAERNLNREIGRLNNYFILHVPDDADGSVWIDGLKALDDVEFVSFVPRPAPLPVPGSFQARQGYLNAASNGIDANYAWGIGDSGQGVTICDFEYWWNLSHQDLPPGITTLVPPGWTPLPVGLGDTNHGTAVLGELASLNNGWGTTGAAYGSNVVVAHTNFSSYGWQIGSAMLYAMTQLSPGDILLIEQQMGGPLHLYIPGNDTGLVPIEWWRPWYDVVVTAVGNGFHVVEAAGNGFQDLDAPVYGTGNGGHWPFLPQNNSGAIIVGAGAAPSSFYGTDTARSRLNFSNYGSRLDLQGWGEGVVTTGYGNLHNSEGTNLWFDSSFAGTSSASPIVAAAVALVESRFETLYGGAMAPVTMRSILKSTGIAQKAGTNPLGQNIGPLPDLNGALNFAANSLAGGTYQVGISRTYTYLANVTADLAGKILLGDVTFELMSDYLGQSGETFPLVFPQYTTAGGNWKVTIRPAAGVTSRLTMGAPPPYLPVIHLQGADRITFDGRAGGTGPGGDWLIRNTRTDSTGPAFLFSNGADDNTLAYLRIESQCSTSTYGTVTFGWNSDSLGNRRNRVAYNHLRDRSDVVGLPQVAVNSLFIPSAPNDSNHIVGNEIFNWASVGALLIGEHWTVDSNSFYSVIPQPNSLTAMQVNTGNGHRIRDNHIGGALPGSQGPPLTIVGNVPFTGITLTVDTLSKTTIERNTIRNIMSASSGSANFFGITCATLGKVRIAGNVIGDTIPPMGVWLSGSGVAGGIDIAFMQGAEIEGNTIVNIRQAYSPAGQVRCISINSPNIFSVEKNRIWSIGTTKAGGSGMVTGIFLDTFIDSVLVANNMIALGFGDSNDCAYYGIYDVSGAGTVKVDLSHNSIAIGGISSGGVNSGGILHTGSSLIRVMNNAVSNMRSGPASFHHTLFNVSPSWLPGMSDFNVLNNLNPASLTYFMGSNHTLPGWRAMTMGDFASINADPVFVNDSVCDLHIDPAAWSPADNGGTPLATVTDDFDGNLRGSPPDIGADEYTINSPGAFVLLSPPNAAVNRPVSDTLRWAPSAAAGFYDLYLDTAASPSTIVAANLTDTQYVYGPIDSNNTWYWNVKAKNSSGNPSAAGAPWSFTTGAASGPLSRSYAYDSSWNMLSVPLAVGDFSKKSLYPSAVSNAFVYNGSYQARDTLQAGPGFWIKFDDTGHAAMTGYPTGPESVDVSTGWNIIGSISDAVTVSSIASDPGGIVTSAFFGYSGGYFTADTIVPGKSYWVKVSQGGKIILTTDTAGMAPVSRIRIAPSAELPPAPPLGGEIGGTGAAAIPSEYGLDQNYPNPFNSTTAIRFHLPVESMVSIRIRDILGRDVENLLEGTEPAGEHTVFWKAGRADGKDLTSGVYYCTIRAVGILHPENVYSETKKILLMK